MTKNIDAIYENGTFRPIGNAKILLPSGTRVRLSVETLDSSHIDNVLDLAASVYAGLSDQEIAEVEQIATDRTEFFSRP